MTPFLLQHLLDQSAAAHPEKIAVIIDDNAITYRALSEKSSRLADLLIQNGFKPRNTACVLLNKSIEAIIAFFGILKAGGTYIPLDLQYMPAERINNILLSSESGFLVSDSENMAGLAATASVEAHFKNMKIVSIDDSELFEKSVQPTALTHCVDSGQQGRHWNDPADHGITDDDPAYILYTSGSTGAPKGVMLTHRNAFTFINWALSYFTPCPEDNFSSHAPFHFDLSIFDIYVSIACGACLNIAPTSICNNPRALIEWMALTRITYWYSVPSVWISILNYATVDPEALSNLSHILFAGEVFPPKHLKQLMELLPQAAYFNLYGPTETNVCTAWHIRSTEAITDRPVPIGRACANTEVVILKDNGDPAEAGEEGELFVKGSIVTKGYYNDPEKTQTAFLKSPLSGHNGALLYRTGDIVRIDRDNIYDYIGRKDLMVKCAGYRIEIPEVEHALCEFEAIEEAVVVPVFNEKRGTTGLHGFVRMKASAAFSVIKIKTHLGRILPKYMIPDTVECVETIPKNANGKIDRQKMKLAVNH